MLQNRVTGLIPPLIARRGGFADLIQGSAPFWSFVVNRNLDSSAFAKEGWTRPKESAAKHP